MNPNQPSNPFALAAPSPTAVVQTAQGEIMQQLQAGYVMAAKRPRDQHAAFQRIMTACQRKGLAEEATYLYARGGTQITGPSIRLLEAIFTSWGNVQSGVIELNQANGESHMMAFAIDLETNVYDSKIFTVKHERYTKAGITKLEDSRDIYEHVANFAARRKRACMEAIIPRDILDSAVEQCEKTLKTGHSEPITDRVRKMVTAFGEYGVSGEMIERKLQHKLDACIEQELVVLRKIFTSLKDGMGKREDFFDVTEAPKAAAFKGTPAQQAQATTAAGPAAAAAAATPAAQAAAATAPRRGRPPGPAKAPSVAASPAPEPEPEATPAADPQAPDDPGEPGEGEAGGEGEPQGEPAAAEGQALAGAAPVDLFADPNSLAAQAYAAIEREKITEEEVLAVYKHRGLCKKTVEQIVQLAEPVLKDLIENANMMAAQVRINRRAAAKK